MGGLDTNGKLIFILLGKAVYNSSIPIQKPLMVSGWEIFVGSVLDRKWSLVDLSIPRFYKFEFLSFGYRIN